MPKTLKWSKEDESTLAEKYQSLSNQELAELFNRSVSAIEKKLSHLHLVRGDSFESVVNSYSKRKNSKELSEQLKNAIEENITLKKEKEIILGVKSGFQVNHLEKISGVKQENEAAVVVQWSDWHCDEVVTLSQTNGLNAFNPQVFNNRSEQLFRTTVRFIDIFRKDIAVNKLVIQLGGDFISGNIHDELKENNSVGVMSSLKMATNAIASGLEYIRKNTKDLDITCVCNAGNHSRITPKQMVSTEYDNSLETFMYWVLQEKFPDVKFLIDDSYFKYVDILGWLCRFHHGHAITYGGGVGGVFIPAYKKIAQWNKGRRVDYDFFDHFHTAKDGGNFQCNGSLIGYNAYAIKIGADYEKPKQMISLIDKRRGKTIVAPIILD